MACLVVLQSSRFESEVCKCKCGRDVTEAWILGTQYCTTVPLYHCTHCLGMSPMYCNAGNGDDSAIAAADRNGVLLYDVS